MKVLCKGKEKTMAKNKMGMKMHERIYQGILWILLIVIALTGIRLIYTITEISVLDMDIDFFTEFLANALSLVVGVEFVKMLCRHSAQTVVEVLLFATARQMVVEHLQPTQTLIGILGIAILFAVRKYLMTDSDDMSPKHHSTDNSEK